MQGIHKHPFQVGTNRLLLQQTCYSAEVDPGTPQHLRWNSLQHLQTAKSC